MLSKLEASKALIRQVLSENPRERKKQKRELLPAEDSELFKFCERFQSEDDVLAGFAAEWEKHETALVEKWTMIGALVRTRLQSSSSSSEADLSPVISYSPSPTPSSPAWSIPPLEMPRSMPRSMLFESGELKELAKLDVVNLADEDEEERPQSPPEPKRKFRRIKRIRVESDPE